MLSNYYSMCYNNIMAVDNSCLTDCLPVMSSSGSQVGKPCCLAHCRAPVPTSILYVYCVRQLQAQHSIGWVYV